MVNRAGKFSTSDQRKILEKNIRINRAVVDKHGKLEKQLGKLGVDTKPKFKIEPPLGGSKLYRYNDDKG